jgi:hypothetical protein
MPKQPPAAKDLGVEYKIEKVSEINEIMRSGVVMTPALAIDGQVKIAGEIADVGAIEKMLL